MNKIEYADLYKFLVSIGILLLSLSVIIPWFFLRESWNVDLTISEISELAPAAQEIVFHRQRIALWFIENTIWVFIFLLCSGLLVLFLGISLWNRKQKELDKRDKLETEKLGLEVKKRRLELEPLTPSQIAEKNLEKEIQEPMLATQVQEYFRIENTIFEKLIKCFGADNVVTQQRIQQVTFDAILLTGGKQYQTDVIFEIRFLTQIGRTSIEKMIRHLAKQISTYEDATGRLATVIPIFSVSSENKKTELIKNFNSVIDQKFQNHKDKIAPFVLLQEEFSSLPCSQLFREIKIRTSDNNKTS